MKSRKFLLPLTVVAGSLISESSQASVNQELIIQKDKNVTADSSASFEQNRMNFEDKSALSFVLKKNDQGVIYADHASHSSHASHRSHASGY